MDSGPAIVDAAGMRRALREVMLARDGLATRAVVTGAVAEHVLAYAVQAGHVVRPLPRTFLLPEAVDDWEAVLRAAL